MPSTIRGSDNFDTAASVASSWVTFDGTGTVAIFDSYNVTSLTDNGTGDYTINLTAALADTNYGIVGNACDSAGAFNRSTAAIPLTTSTYRMTTFTTATDAKLDIAYISSYTFGGI